MTTPHTALDSRFSDPDARAVDWDTTRAAITAADRVVDRTTLDRLAQAWQTKWDGRWEFGVTDEGFGHDAGGAAHVFSVRPTRVLVFGKDPFSHTSHRFPPPSA